METVETRTPGSRGPDDILKDPVAVDVLKVDVRGATHTVLDHARAVSRRALACHVEAEFAPVHAGGPLFAVPRENGFAFVDFFSLGRQRHACLDTSTAGALAPWMPCERRGYRFIGADGNGVSYSCARASPGQCWMGWTTCGSGRHAIAIRATTARWHPYAASTGVIRSRICPWSTCPASAGGLV